MDHELVDMRDEANVVHVRYWHSVVTEESYDQTIGGKNYSYANSMIAHYINRGHVHRFIGTTAVFI